MDTALKLTLDAEALAPFHAAWRSAVRQQLRQPDAGVLDAAEQRLRHLEGAPLPGFVRERLALVPDVLALLRDGDWSADEQVRHDLTGALAYLTEPLDLIPDDQPRFGLLDDALVLDMALALHGGEYRAWRAFDAFRRRHCAQGESLPRADWFDLQRRQERSARRSGNTARSGFERSRMSYVAPVANPLRFQVH